MFTIRVAHVCGKKEAMIIVPLDEEFGSKSPSEKKKAIARLSRLAIESGLWGNIVPVWQTHGGLSFVAPKRWHHLIQSISWTDISSRMNAEINVCGKTCR